MQKILELSTKQWMTGCGLETDLDNSPIFIQSGTRGVSSVTPFLSDSQITGSLGVNAYGRPVSGYTKGSVGIITSAVLDLDDSTSYSEATTFAYDDKGNLYERPVTNNSGSQSATLIRSGNPLSDGASGLAIFEKADGDRYLLYAREAAIGRTLQSFGLNTFQDNWATTDIETTTNHPMHRFQDRVYFGNGRYVGMISEEAGSMTVNAQALDLPATEEITNLSDDGKYLIIATKKGFVYFWNTNTDSWQRSYQVPNPGELYAVETVRNVTYCLGVEVLATVGFSSPPEVIHRFPNTNSVSNTASYDSVSYPNMGPVQHSEFRGGDLYTQNVAGVIGEGIVWGNGQNCLSYYGNITPGMDKRLHTFAHSLGSNDGDYEDGNVLMYMLSNNNFAIDVFTHSFDFDAAGTPDEDTEYYEITDSSDYEKMLEPSDFGTGSDYENFASNVQAITRPINLEENYQITGAKIIFSTELGATSYSNIGLGVSGKHHDKVTLEFKTNDGGGRLSSNNGLNNDEPAILEWSDEDGDSSQIKRLKNPLTGEILQLRIRFRERDPRIKSIIIYGEPVADLT